MADAAVESLLENLKNVLLYHSHLIQDVQMQVETLEKDMRLFKAFLKDFNGRPHKDATLQDLVKEIRSIVYKIEDEIDTLISQSADKKSKIYFRRWFLGTGPANLIKVVDDVAAIRAKVGGVMHRAIMIDMAPQTERPELELSKAPILVREDKIVGFDEDANNIITYMMEETEELDVISIIGLPGLGKTTLAGKVFRDPRIEYEFPTRIWVYVSQEFKRRDVFLTILKKIISNPDRLEEKTDKEIAQTLRGHLDKARFLIVMDDVWSAEAWSELKDAFPKMHKTGKILITSRNVEVARQANKVREPYFLRFLSPDESLLLLQLEVFGRPFCPEEFKPYGRTIVKKCGGLPLAIVVIGGILGRKTLFEDPLTWKNTWQIVAESVHTYLGEDRTVNGIIGLSYNKLPSYLKPCFLYLGMFPKDFDIPVWNLIRLWIAEGFISGRATISLEQIAKDYLRELIRYNLVEVGKVSLDGQIKTCRIHSLLNEFCKKEAEAEKENAFQEFKRSAEGDFMPSISTLEICRRVCIHSSILEFISMPELFGPRVRSFLCYSKEESFNLPFDYYSNITAAFKLLKVLDATPITFSKVPRGLSLLVHLRYVVLSSNFKVIPEAFGMLWNLQTFVIYTSSHILDIKANIWKLLQLRHVKTNACAILPKTGKRTKEISEKLQTLESISPQSCTDEVLDRLHNLRILSIRGLLVLLLDANGFEKLENLDKLKLVNDLYGNPYSLGCLPRLPHAHKFPPRLRRLTLCSTNLEWNHMATLGLLENLEMLKLKKNAFMGKRLETSFGGFCHLEVLQIDDTDLEVWVAEANHFPSLKCLVLRNCEQLLEIPYKLSQIQSFQRLDLKRVPKAAASARKIEAEKKAQAEKEVDPYRRTKFKFYIDPGDE